MMNDQDCLDKWLLEIIQECSTCVQQGTLKQDKEDELSDAFFKLDRYVFDNQGSAYEALQPVHNELSPGCAVYESDDSWKDARKLLIVSGSAFGVDMFLGGTIVSGLAAFATLLGVYEGMRSWHYARQREEIDRAKNVFSESTADWFANKNMPELMRVCHALNFYKRNIA